MSSETCCITEEKSRRQRHTRQAMSESGRTEATDRRKNLLFELGARAPVRERIARRLRVERRKSFGARKKQISK
jgi:hypothetical protein